VRGGDVEKDDFVGALVRVAMGERSWITSVDEVYKLDAFDHAAVAHVQAGYDAASQH
jgi:hypothetical protein